MIEGGARYENLAWRLWSHQAKAETGTLPLDAILSADTKNSASNPLSSPTRLSETELSTDESFTSEDSAAPFKDNKFELVIPMVGKEQTWADELVEKARGTSSRYSNSAQSSSTTDHENEQAVDDGDTVMGTDSRSVGTPISTTGTITPRCTRSRANSTATSPRNSILSSPRAPIETRTATSTAAPAAPSSEAQQVGQSLRMTNATMTRPALPSITEKTEAPSRSATTLSLAGRSRRGRGLKSVENLTAIRGTNKLASRNSMLQMLTPADEGTKRDKQKQKKKKGKIIFTVGDVSDEDENKSTKDGIDEDEWASEDEEEEQRRRAAEEAAEKERRAKEEEMERVEMFKKRPIRSVSLADLNAAEAMAQKLPHMMPMPETGLARGLLSTIFQPSDAQRARGGSASGPSRSGRSLHLSQMPPRLDVRTAARNTSVPALTPTHTTNHHAPTSHNPYVARSKSAIALPLLDLTSLRSSTATTHGPDSPKSLSQRDDHSSVTGSELEESQGPMNRTKSSTALARLSALAQRKSSETEMRKLASLVRTYSSMGKSTKTPMPPSPTLTKEHEGPSLAVQPDETDIWVAQVPQRVPTPASPPLKKETVSPRDAGIPMPVTSPQTTRQNMLSDELSESLRQNLLWERQSRARILGLDSPKRKSVEHRRSVSGTVRPTAKKLWEDESFHHKGW